MLKRNQILQFLEKHAPGMPLKEALWLANDCEKIYNEGLFEAECLAALSVEVIGISPKGEIPKKFDNVRPGIKLALKQAQYRHAWVSCCGQGAGMESILTKLDIRYGKDFG